MFINIWHSRFIFYLLNTVGKRSIEEIGRIIKRRTDKRPFCLVRTKEIIVEVSFGGLNEWKSRVRVFLRWFATSLSQFRDICGGYRSVRKSWEREKGRRGIEDDSMRPRCFLAIVQITSGPGGPVPKFELRSSTSCLYLSELDDARDDRENISPGRGVLFLETINAPSNRAW